MSADAPDPHPPLLPAHDEKFSFMTDGEAEKARYEQLARDTWPVVAGLPGLGGADFQEPSPESAAFFLLRWDHEVGKGRYPPLPDALDRRWREWAEHYYEIRRRSPKLEMRDLIQGITERQEGLSWPFHATEDILEEWILAGDFDAPIGSHLYDPQAVTRETFERLRELRLQTGGWIYDDGSRLRFAADEEWEDVKRDMRMRSGRWRWPG
jgi:hypothetical protein